MGRWFIESKSAGILKKLLYELLQYCFKFSKWHIMPINRRPYALEIYRTLSHYINKPGIFHNALIIEVGCGLGDIIGSLTWDYGKIGFDLSANVLKAARLIHPTVVFRKGTFNNIHYGNVSCLIMINFIHAISYEDLKKYIDEVLDKNKVEMFVLDTFRNNAGTEYTYSHDGNFLFDGKYKLYKRSQGFSASNGAKRYIEYWKAK